MDTKALEKFCPWARTTLIDAVHNRCVKLSLDDAGRTTYPAGSDVIGAGVIDAGTKAQRDGLYARIEKAGYSAFCQQMAYTWFNRFAGIRYMELHGFLPNGVRMLSAQDGSFDPECLRAVGELELAGLDRDHALDLAAKGDDSELFRLILIAQCNELADALPDVFSPVGAADELTLPDGLLNRDENNVLYHLVTEIPEGAWQDVEILGWMYQFYNAELKADFFKSKRKAAVEDIAPATQLFTPEWIVRYMVDNSLGRLWMLNFPESTLPERARAQNPADRLMEYYIAPDGEHEDFIRIASPEDITFCDPACGSGHILVYAFKMLFALYEERGYREREIPELILTKNLAGLEIDPRAAQIAQLALALCAREHDRRFFTRNVAADVQVLESVEIDAEQLGDEQLAETLAHLSEIGSLFTPSDMDIALLEAQRGTSSAAGLFAEPAGQSVEQALTACKALSRRFDVVVANPPYMGSSSFNPFVSKWVKKHYPDSCKDLCTAFIERELNLMERDGYAGIITSDTCMYLSSFEKLRNRLIDDAMIISLIDTRGTNAHPDVFDANAGWVITKSTLHGFKSSYFKLNQRIGEKADALLEAIQNPDCGWFYRADAAGFHDIPGSPIAYWASEAVLQSFCEMQPIGTWLTTREGMATADNDRFVRKWWEVSTSKSAFDVPSSREASTSNKKWFPYQKGGEFRKWFGNNDLVVNWARDGAEIKGNVDPSTGRIRSHNYNGDYAFRSGITWSSLSSGRIHLRYSPEGSLFDSKGAKGFADSSLDTFYALALLNSEISNCFLSFLAPTLDFKVGDVIEIPDAQRCVERTSTISMTCIQLSKDDYTSQETSWDFKRCPLT